MEYYWFCVLSFISLIFEVGDVAFANGDSIISWSRQCSLLQVVNLFFSLFANGAKRRQQSYSCTESRLCFRFHIWLNQRVGANQLFHKNVLSSQSASLIYLKVKHMDWPQVTVLNPNKKVQKKQQRYQR